MVHNHAKRVPNTRPRSADPRANGQFARGGKNGGRPRLPGRTQKRGRAVKPLKLASLGLTVSTLLGISAIGNASEPAVTHALWTSTGKIAPNPASTITLVGGKGRFRFRPVYQDRMDQAFELREVKAPDGTITLERIAVPVRRQAFIMGNDRYEPRIRDIRLVPVSTTLPQTISGSIDTLPVLPPQSDGYFVIPRTR